MNIEIKEILDRIETASEIFDCLLKPKECTELLDYITNLQEEKQKIIHTNIVQKKQLNNKINKLQEENKMYAQLKDEYEDIIDKAIKYLTNGDNIIDLFTKHDFRKYPDFNVFEGENPNENVCCAELYGYYELLNILQGEDNGED